MVCDRGAAAFCQLLSADIPRRARPPARYSLIRRVGPPVARRNPNVPPTLRRDGTACGFSVSPPPRLVTPPLRPQLMHAAALAAPLQAIKAQFRCARKTQQFLQYVP